MNLDEIKKTWQENEIKTNISEDLVQKMIDNQGKSALDKLVRYEKFGLVALFFCILVLPLFWYFGLIAFVSYLLLLIVSFIWQIYKIKLLKDIDFLKMGILAVYKKTIQYRKYLYGEVILGIPVFVFFASISIQHQFLQGRSISQIISNGLTHELIMGIVYWFCILIIVILIYYIYYLRNIKKLEKSITEIKEFEGENK